MLRPVSFISPSILTVDVDPFHLGFEPTLVWTSAVDQATGETRGLTHAGSTSATGTWQLPVFFFLFQEKLAMASLFLSKS